MPSHAVLQGEVVDLPAALLGPAPTSPPLRIARLDRWRWNHSCRTAMLKRRSTSGVIRVRIIPGLTNAVVTKVRRSAEPLATELSTDLRGTPTFCSISRV